MYWMDILCSYLVLSVKTYLSQWDKNTTEERKGIPLIWFIMFTKSFWSLILTFKVTNPSLSCYPLCFLYTAVQLQNHSTSPLMAVSPPLTTGKPAVDSGLLSWSGTSCPQWEYVGQMHANECVLASRGWIGAGTTGLAGNASLPSLAERGRTGNQETVNQNFTLHRNTGVTHWSSCMNLLLVWTHRHACHCVQICRKFPISSTNKLPLNWRTSVKLYSERKHGLGSLT